MIGNFLLGLSLCGPEATDEGGLLQGTFIKQGHPPLLVS